MKKVKLLLISMFAFAAGYAQTEPIQGISPKNLGEILTIVKESAQQPGNYFYDEDGSRRYFLHPTEGGVSIGNFPSDTKKQDFFVRTVEVNSKGEIIYAYEEHGSSVPPFQKVIDVEKGINDAAPSDIEAYKKEISKVMQHLHIKG